MSESFIRQQIVNILLEKNIVLSEIILFGSRARLTHSDKSDFDILVVLEQDLSISEKMLLSKTVRETLAKHFIDIDIFIKSTNELLLDQSKKWTIAYQALKEGISI